MGLHFGPLVVKVSDDDVWFGSNRKLTGDKATEQKGREQWEQS